MKRKSLYDYDLGWMEDPDMDKAQKEAIRRTEISILCETLKGAMIQYPELRLGQLIVNATGVSDPFYVTDLAMLKFIQDYMLENF